MAKANAKCCELLEKERQKLIVMMSQGEDNSSIVKQSQKLDKLIVAFMTDKDKEKGDAGYE